MIRKTTLFALVLALILAAAVYSVSSVYFRAGEVARAEGRLSLYQSTVLAEVERFSHLTFVLARDQAVRAALLPDPKGDLNQRLALFSERADLDAIYLMQSDGKTVAASNAETPQSFVGQNYSFRPYFEQASLGGQGRFYGIGATTGLPGYFIADPVRDEQGDVLGVVAAKIDLTRLENSWRDAGETVFLTNADGVILLASNPTWRYRALAALSPARRAEIAQTRQFTGQALAPLDWATGDARATIDGVSYVHLRTNALPHGWTLHYLASQAPITTRSLLVLVSLAIAAVGGLLVLQRRKTARIGVALRQSEAEEAQLRLTNDKLAHEIAERRATERRLEKTRDELARASRLAALGKLAASITHELGQPISAMRNHLAAVEIAGTAPQALVPKVGGLVDRMDGIITQLRFFARDGVSDIGEIDLSASVRAALDLVDGDIAARDVKVMLDLPKQTVLVRGNALRLEQVFTNLMRNALDAMQAQDAPEMQLRLQSNSTSAWVSVVDNGHGLGAADIGQLQEPFVTSKASGVGMGLGLAISADIVAEHDGALEAGNNETGGAWFKVSLPLAKTDETE